MEILSIWYNGVLTTNYNIMPKGVKGFQKGHKFFGDLSKSNYFQKGDKIRLGQTHTEEAKAKMSKVHKGKHHSPETEFKKKEITCHDLAGGRVKYRTLHTWVTKNLGRSTKCENCGRDGLTGHQIHWANKSGEYKKIATDWIRLCVKCHHKKDRL